MVYGAHLTFSASEDSRPPATVVPPPLSLHQESPFVLIDEEKATLRRALRRKRVAFAKSPRAGAAQSAIVAHLRAFADKSAAHAFGGFLAAKGEPDIGALSRMNRPYALPWLCQDTPGKMVFRAIEETHNLTIGPHGLMQPEDDAPVLEPDVLFVPLVGFDGHGRRLGQGGGYYDRYLAKARRTGEVFALGVCFACQEADAIPATSHDIPLDALVTEEGMRYF